MSEHTPIFNNWMRGEVGNALDSRIELQDYAQALSVCENALLTQQGQVTKRPGIYFVAEAKSSSVACRMIPYERSDLQNYVIEMGNLYARFYTNGARIENPPGTPVEIVTPWATADLPKLQFFQEYDKLYVLHENYAPRIIQRTTDDNTWTISTYSSAPFNSANNYPRAGCFWQGRLIFAGTITKPTTVWGSRVGDYTTWSTWTFDIDAAPTPADWSVGATLTGLTSGATCIVVAKITNINYIVRALSGNFQYAETVTDGTNSRICAAGWPKVYPASLPAEPWEFTIAADRAMTIQWCASGNDLLVGTSGGEWMFSGGDGVFYSQNFLLKRQTRHGSARIQPVSFGARCMYVQKTAETLRSLSYEMQANTYEAPDLTVAHPLVMKGGVAHMDAQVTPSQRIWAPRVDGQLLTFSFESNQGFAAWSRQKVDDGDAIVESVAVITNGAEDQVWISAFCNAKRMIGYMKPIQWAEHRDCFFVDFGLTFDYGAPKTVTGATQANPIHVSCTSHGIANNDKVHFSAIGGMTLLNTGFFTVKNATTHAFDIYDETGTYPIDGTIFELEVDTAPTPANFPAGATISGLSSGQSCTVLQEVAGSAGKKYICNARTGAFSDGEVITDGTNSVDCATGYPLSTFLFKPYTSGGTATGYFASLTGLSHLEGKEIDIMVDGANHPRRTVASGAVSLQTWGNRVQAGLPFKALMRLMRQTSAAEKGPGLGKKKRISKLLLGFIETVGCLIGPDENHLTEIPWRAPEALMDAVPEPFSGFKETSFEGTWGPDGWIVVANDQPQPWTINMVMPYLEVKDL